MNNSKNMYQIINYFYKNNDSNETNTKKMDACEISKKNIFIKCLLIGSSGVGKSSILERYTSNNFNEYFISTIGVDYRFKNMEIDNYNVKLQIWDTASQERFRCITSNYYRNSHIIIVCFDVTDVQSFNDLEYWISDCQKNLTETVIMVICGTKIDLEKKRLISFDEAKKFADYKNLDYFEVSSKDGNGVNYMFETVIKNKIKENDYIKISVEPEIQQEIHPGNNKILNINNTYYDNYYNDEINCCW